MTAVRVRAAAVSTGLVAALLTAAAGLAAPATASAASAHHSRSHTTSFTGHPALASGRPDGIDTTARAHGQSALSRSAHRAAAHTATEKHRAGSGATHPTRGRAHTAHDAPAHRAPARKAPAPGSFDPTVRAVGGSAAEAASVVVARQQSGTDAGRHSARPVTSQRSHAQPPAGNDLPSKVLAPLRRLGQTISNVTGFSLFGGPVGWVFTGLLLVAASMILASLLVGRRRSPAAAHPA